MLEIPVIKNKVKKDNEDDQDVSIDSSEDDTGAKEQDKVSKDKDDMSIDDNSKDDEDVGREADAGAAVYEGGAVRDPPGGVTSTQQEGKGICKKNLLSGVRRVYALHVKRSISKIVPPPPLKNPLYTPVNIFVKININEP